MAAISNPPTAEESALAKETSRVLSARLQLYEAVRLKIVDDHSSKTVRLPAPAAQLLVRILDEMARGNAVTVLPVQPEVTTQDAADLLNISRPSLIRLLNEGKLSHHRVGAHRRIPLDELLKYKRQADAARRAALAELAAYDQELGI